MRNYIIILLFTVFYFLVPVPSVYADELSELKIQMQKIQEENLLLRKQLNEQKEQLNAQDNIIQPLMRKIDDIEAKMSVSSTGEQEIKGVVEEILAEKEQERELLNLFSEGGLDNMIFHGYTDLEWKNDEFDRAQGGTRGHNFFDNHHFNLWFGYRMADNLIAKGELEIEHAGEEWKLEFGDIEWKPFSNDNLELLLGKVLVPLGIENPVHASVWNKLISRPLPSISIIPGTYGDVGFEARGWLPSYDDAKMRYHLYVVNGLGDNDADNIYEQNRLKRSRDNNNNKAVGGQIALFPIKELELGGSGYFGKWDDNGANDTFISGAHLIYKKDPVEIRTEYVFQRIENANGANSRDANLQGWYLQGAYKFSSLNINGFLNRCEAVSRYDWMNNEDGVAGLKQGAVPSGRSEQRIAFGLVFRPQDWLQFKMEYLYRDQKDAENDNGLALQTVVNW